MVTHDLGVRLNTPTVNLFIYPKDYLAMLENLEQNIYAPIEDITGNSPYPVGLLAGSIHLYFQHYKSFDEAVECWRRRAPRLNMKNLFVVMIERDGCSYEDLKRFDALPYKNKLALTHKPYDDIVCARVISGYSDKGEVGTITDSYGRLGRRLYDRFNWIEFLNQ